MIRRSSPPSRRRRFAAAVLVALLVTSLGACSSSSDGPDGADASTTAPGTMPPSGRTVSKFPMAIVLGDAVVTIQEQPKRIVSLSPTITEILFALDAGPQVIAVDTGSTFPGDAPVTDLDASAPDIDSIAAEDPDLVLLTTDSGGVADGLKAKGIPAVVIAAPASPDAVFELVTLLGRATGHEDEAAALNKVLYDDVQAVIDGEADTLGPTIAETVGPATHALLEGFVVPSTSS